MGYLARSFVYLTYVLTLVHGDTYSVKIHTQRHINIVDARFLSFTIDPKYLFSSTENSKECVCMASALTPAYLRIAGPSTAHMNFHNATISISTDQGSRGSGKLAVEYRQWKKFLHWANATGFDLVFALNNEERMDSGMWDPNSALNILTVAEKTNIGDIFWQLGYECTNQSIEEYLNDLQTLKVITETFGPGEHGSWNVVGGDITGCLHADSKSDFKDYLILSTEMMHAVMLNGNSSSQELERMSEGERIKLLKLLTKSPTPLWLSECTQKSYSELERAVDWLTSLGFSARNGFSVHFRELLEEEMYEPSLSFYMALLFKNLVGERVLNVEMDPDQAILFAHCTSLHRKHVPGAVTIFGANMDDEPARMSIKLSEKEEGGDIMQYILGHDFSGNIIVNGRPMYYEGDIKPIVKRVRPYKTLLINLPPKSFGFWVLANTNVEACQETEDGDVGLLVDTVATIDDEMFRRKRSIDSIDFLNNNDLVNTANKVSNNLMNILKNQLKNAVQNTGLLIREKRQIDEHLIEKGKQKLRQLKSKVDRKFTSMENKSKNLFGNLLQLTRRNITKNKNNRKRRINNTKINKRNSKHIKTEPKIRQKRSVLSEKPNNHADVTTENEIYLESKENMKLWKILHKINKELQALSEEKIEDSDTTTDVDRHGIGTNASDDDTSDINESRSGFVNSTIKSLMTVLSDLNKNLNKFWKAITLLE